MYNTRNEYFKEIFEIEIFTGNYLNNKLVILLNYKIFTRGKNFKIIGNHEKFVKIKQ